MTTPLFKPCMVLILNGNLEGGAQVVWSEIGNLIRPRHLFTLTSASCYDLPSQISTFTSQMVLFFTRSCLIRLILMAL